MRFPSWSGLSSPSTTPSSVSPGRSRWFRRSNVRSPFVAGVPDAAALGVVVLSSAGFVALSRHLAGVSGVHGLEADLFSWLADRVRPTVLGDVLEVVKSAGSSTVVVGSAALASVVAARRRRFDVVLFAGWCFVSAAAVSFVLKPVVGRTKSGNLAFPSGHSTGAVVSGVLLAAVVLLTDQRDGPLRGVLLSVVAVVFSTAFFSPVVGGWHYPLDSVGSLLWCAAVLPVGWRLSSAVGGMLPVSAEG